MLMLKTACSFSLKSLRPISLEGKAHLPGLGDSQHFSGSTLKAPSARSGEATSSRKKVPSFRVEPCSQHMLLGRGEHLKVSPGPPWHPRGAGHEPGGAGRHGWGRPSRSAPAVLALCFLRFRKMLLRRIITMSAKSKPLAPLEIFSWIFCFSVTDLLLDRCKVTKVIRESFCFFNIYHVCSSCNHLSVNMTFYLFNFVRTFSEYFSILMRQHNLLPISFSSALWQIEGKAFRCAKLSMVDLSLMLILQKQWKYWRGEENVSENIVWLMHVFH